MHVKLNLKDHQITINGYISNCHCKCNHCLLCSGDEKIKKVPFEKLKELALKFQGVREGYKIDSALCIYNCSEYDKLFEEMEINKNISFYPGYQNLNGSKIREGTELKEWVGYLKQCGVTNANLSWFGERDFHDKFVNRKGYFDYLINLTKELKLQGVTWNNTVFLLKSNISQIEPLTNILKEYGENIYYSLLDYRGNAKNIYHEYLTEEDKDLLPKFIDETNIFHKHKPEYQWIKKVEEDDYPELKKRIMFLVATPNNIDSYLKMTVEEIFHMFHNIDHELQKSIPSIKFLSVNYGDKENRKLIDFRSLLWKWIDMYYDENPNLNKSLLFSDLHTSVMWR